MQIVLWLKEQQRNKMENRLTGKGFVTLCPAIPILLVSLLGAQNREISRFFLLYATIYSIITHILFGGVVKLKCPFCGYSESRVIDSRPTDEGERIRRRRECLKCAKRFTTYEIIENVPIVVIKKDKSRETFDRNKLLSGLLRACEKRPVSIDTLERIVDEIETLLQNSLDREVSSQRIGTYAMEKLKTVDEVAYVRFASVYRQFKDINSFMEELSKIISSKKD